MFSQIFLARLSFLLCPVHSQGGIQQLQAHNLPLSLSSRARKYTLFPKSLGPSPRRSSHWSRLGHVATSEPVIEILIDFLKPEDGIHPF